MKYRNLIVAIFILCPIAIFSQIWNVTIIQSDRHNLVEDQENSLPVLYLSPSVSLDVFKMNWNTKKYQLGINPGIGYGIRWNPSWWQDIGKDILKGYFLAIDLFVSGDIADDNVTYPGPDYFNIDLLPSLSIINWFSIGAGCEIKLSLNQSLNNEINFIISFGIKRNI